MPTRKPVVTLGAAEPRRLAEFWSALLGRDLVEDDQGRPLVGAEPEVALRFERSDAQPDRPHRLHLHVTSTDADDQQRTVTRALSLGGQHLDVGQLEEEGHLVLADPAGYELCVIEPGSSFLDGCGVLGEVACDGSRAVGLFWSAALEWPLVWDQDEETAIQSPDGGTKIAWGGPPVHPRTSPERAHLDIVTDGELSSEVERLVALGAVELDVLSDGRRVLLDPGGAQLHLHGR